MLNLSISLDHISIACGVWDFTQLILCWWHALRTRHWNSGILTRLNSSLTKVFIKITLDWNLIINAALQLNSLGKQQQTPSGATYDLEPVYTFRGHSSRVVSMTLSNNLIYSGAQNGELFIWSVPANVSSIDPYDAYDTSLSAGVLAGHNDSIWSLLTLEGNSGAPLLCSASSDATIKIWDTNRQQCINTISWDGKLGRPLFLTCW